MRALTLWQPWAQLVVTGGKLIETRSWPTKVRGPIAIHAAKRKPDAFEYIDLTGLPLGAVVGTVEILDCQPIEELYGTKYDTPRERAFGNWKRARFGWILGNPRRFDAPVAASGRQGFWTWDEAVKE